MNLQLRSAYWDDLEAREAFKRFILEIHGLDFEAWEAAGYWDEAYTPFSFFAGDAVVASVCVYLLDVFIHGRRTRLAQISGVGTLPEFRRQGLSRELTQLGLSWAGGKHDGVFLFANEAAVPYYERCGFQPRTEYVVRLQPRRVEARPGAVRLDCAQRANLDSIYGRAKRRSPPSREFSILNAKLFMFHVLYGLREHVYDIPDLDVLVLARRTSGCLQVLDVVGERIPSWEELHPYIADESDRIVEFHFSPDRLGLEATDLVPLDGNHCFTQGVFPLAKPVFPYTSRA